MILAVLDCKFCKLDKLSGEAVRVMDHCLEQWLNNSRAETKNVPNARNGVSMKSGHTRKVGRVRHMQ